MTQASLVSRLVRGLLIGLYRLRGWRIEGAAPRDAKFVLVGAPHSSNWDFAIFLGVTDALGIAPNFLGKHSLFRGPLRRFMTDMGGIAVDRSKRSNYVEQVVAEFRRRESLALVIAPEGSRDSDGRWKSGFYHIAMGAGVPIVPAWIDRRTRRGKIGAAIMPSGDYRADLARIAAFYREAQPDHPRFAMIDRPEGDSDDLSNPGHKRLGEAP